MQIKYVRNDKSGAILEVRQVYVYVLKYGYAARSTMMKDSRGYDNL